LPAPAQPRRGFSVSEQLSTTWNAAELGTSERGLGGGVHRAARQTVGMQTMTTDEAMAFLAKGARTGKLATASPAGAVHVAPVWFVTDGNDLAFTTYFNTVKARHLSANPQAALTVDDEEFPYAFVVARGPVTVDTTAEDLAEWTHRIAARYVPADRAAEFGRRNAIAGEWLCRLHVRHLIGQSEIAD
jgi:PPOX class probable F420-dependent enzyme